MDLVFSVSERVNEMKAEPVGDDSQVTLPSLDPPIRFCKRGGEVKRERWYGKWQKPETIPFLLSTPTLLRSFTPPHHPPLLTYITVACAAR